MGYQALLFCPDEKTARTVTQVLSELDFAVISCTEPFAAVKKLMGEHFDAVVVDCDNEQNATLLFKSARNAPNNHSSLAVAVVEGQAGVAKAFRIGANLVLTKPVNVEQAKGTLRVARGLLRKSEAAKPAAGAATTAVKPAVPAPGPPKLVPQRTIPGVSSAGAAAPMTPWVAAGNIPAQKPQQPSVVASAPSEITEPGTDLFEAAHETISPSNVAPETKIAARQAGTPSQAPGRSPSSGGFGTGAASAPAPARDPKSSVGTEDKPSGVTTEAENPVEETVVRGNDSLAEALSAPAPSLTLGGTVDSGSESGGGRKKALLAVAAIVLVAAVGYEVWMQWVRSSGAATPFTQVVAQPKTTSTAVPAAAPKPAPTAPSSDASSSAPSSTAAAKQTDTNTTASSTDSSKRPASSVAENEAPAKSGAVRPIVIKNRAAQPVAGKSAPSADAPAPNLDGIATGNSTALPNLADSGKTPAPVLQDLHISQGVSRGLLVREIQPAYPAIALRMRIEGAVELSATISKNGDISSVKVLSGEPQLVHAAVAAVKQWKYKPYLLNGEPVEIQTPVTVKFRLPR
jgi:protein TonB